MLAVLEPVPVRLSPTAPDGPSSTATAAPREANTAKVPADLQPFIDQDPNRADRHMVRRHGRQPTVVSNKEGAFRRPPATNSPCRNDRTLAVVPKVVNTLWTIAGRVKVAA